MSGQDFILGNPYFFLEFVDRRMKYPVVSTIVYIGKNLRETEISRDNKEKWYFQDPASYIATGSLADRLSAAHEVPDSDSPSGDGDGSEQEVRVFDSNAVRSVLTLQELRERLAILGRTS
jgi:hypothetical protein